MLDKPLLRRISNNDPTLTHLDLILDSTKKGIELIQALQKNKIIKVINLSYNLRGLDEDNIKQLCELISDNESVTDLSLGWNSISDSAADVFEQMLSKNVTLRTLYLEGASLDTTVVQKMCQALSVNTTLQILDLNGTNLHFKEMGLQALSEMLTVNSTLIELNLGENSLGYKGLLKLKDGLAKNIGLKALNLSHTCVDSDCIPLINEILGTNHTLTQLNLYSNRLGDTGIERLCSILATNASLRMLDLASNEISPEGAKPLSDMLRVNTGLTDLQLGGNKLSDRGVIVLSEMFSHNTSLLKLSLGYNRISEEGIEIISKKITNHPFLCGIDLSDNEIDDSGADENGAIIKIMRHLQLNDFKRSIVQGDVASFRQHLANGLPLLQEHYNIAAPEIRTVLDYRPCKKKNQPTIFEYYNHSEMLGLSLDKVKWLLYDQENSSDEDSSDSENDEPQLLKPVNEHQLKLYRSVNFHPSYFKTACARREARKCSYHQKPTYSYATEQLAQRLPRKVDNTLDYEQADSLVRGYFTMLKLTPDKQEREETGRIFDRGNFANLYYHFVQAYKNSYNQLINKGGMSRNFNFFSNDNPVVSTSLDSKKSSEYVSRAITAENLMSLKLRRSTGSFKHRRFGYILAFAMDPDYLKKHAFSIDEMQDQGAIKIKHHYKTDAEFGFESSILAESVLAYQVLALPDLNQEWSQTIEQCFGLNQNQYSHYQNCFLGGNMDSLSKLIKLVTEHQTKCLTNKIDDEINKAQLMDASEELTSASVFPI